ncbi:MAG: hypothetical protein AB7J46_07480 [Candidatus Altimarinota bacterium]
MAGEKLVRIEVELDAKENKNNPELDNLIQSGTQRSDTEKFNGIAKINGLYSLAPFLKELGNESKQKIFQKGEQFFATNTAKDSLYLVLLDLGTLVQHQQKNGFKKGVIYGLTKLHNHFADHRRNCGLFVHQLEKDSGNSG